MGVLYTMIAEQHNHADCILSTEISFYFSKLNHDSFSKGNGYQMDSVEKLLREPTETNDVSLNPPVLREVATTGHR